MVLGQLLLLYALSVGNVQSMFADLVILDAELARIKNLRIEPRSLALIVVELVV
jgi:hypothetical protein